MDRGIATHITGRDRKGKSAFTSSAPVPETADPRQPAVSFNLIWGTQDGLPSLDDMVEPVQVPFFPGPGGTRFIVCRYKPHQVAAFAAQMPGGPSAKRGSAADPRFSGVLETHDADGTDGFHTTDTIDYGVVLSGAVCLELDDGREIELSKGDCFVQRGTRHAWRNRGDVEADVAFVIIGTQPSR
jgi:quercetin dioxygenase-like cupin family protein